MKRQAERIEELEAEIARLKNWRNEKNEKSVLLSALQEEVETKDAEIAVLRKAEATIRELKKELEEQARLNGMGSEREARKDAIIEEQRREIEKLRGYAEHDFDCAQHRDSTLNCSCGLSEAIRSGENVGKIGKIATACLKPLHPDAKCCCDLCQ